jgi:hypothetical protein
MLSGMDTAEKVRDNLLRRMAARQGLVLRRSARRDRRALDYGLYWLVNSRGNAVTGMISMDEAERYLRGESE